LKTLILLLLFISTAAWSKYLTGEGEFLSIESDKPTFVKKQLIYSAKKNILNTHLTSLDLSPQEFWQGFDSKIEEKIKTKVDWFDEKILEMQSAENFDELLNFQIKKRELILTQKAKYLERSRVFSSYSIKNRSQSLTNPSLKFIRMKVKINKTRLKSFYFSLTKQNLERTFDKMFVNLTFEDHSSLYSNDQGESFQSEMMEDIKIALIQKWKRFFEKEYGEIVKNIIFISDEESDDFEKKLSIAPEDGEREKSSVDLIELESKKNSDVGSTEVLVETPPPTDKPTKEGSENIENEIIDGELYLKIQYSFMRAKYDTENQKGSYAFKGGVALFDLRGRSSIFFDDFNFSEGELFSSLPNSFYSSLATKLYNYPIKSLRKNKESIARYPSVNNSLSIKVHKPKNMNDVYALNDFLAISGANHNFLTSNFIILDDSVYFDLYFNGPKSEALNKFRQWESKKISNKLVMMSSVDDRSVEISLEETVSSLEGEIKNENAQ
tara:strand:- start:5145 stop:6632 length:1488 start_codon:yes stop_codon:yes gene_type:complete